MDFDAVFGECLFNFRKLIAERADGDFAVDQAVELVFLCPVEEGVGEGFFEVQCTSACWKGGGDALCGVGEGAVEEGGFCWGKAPFGPCLRVAADDGGGRSIRIAKKGFGMEVFLVDPPAGAFGERVCQRWGWLGEGLCSVEAGLRGDGGDFSIIEFGQASGVEVEPGGREVSFEVRAADEIGFSGGLQASDPSPGKGIGGGIAIEQVAVKKGGSQLPRKPADVNPKGGEPHPRVVVEVAGFDQFAGEGVHDCAAAAACGNGIGMSEDFLGKTCGIDFCGGPGGRVPLKPALPIDPPQDLLDKFFASLWWKIFDGEGGNFHFGDEPVADGGGEPGDTGMLGWPDVVA